MSIRQYIEEIDAIRQEIKLNNKRNTELRKRYKVLESAIKEYLQKNDQYGMKYNKTAIVLEQTKSRKMQLTNIMASGNKVSIEGKINTESHDGLKKEWNFAVFFVIDEKKGLIVSDHSYMPNTPGMKILKPEE